MKLLTVPSARTLSWREVDDPTPLPNEVRIAVRHVGICGSDVDVFLGLRPAHQRHGHPVIGHEMSGRIDTLGDAVRGLRVGDLVSVNGAWGAFADFVTATPDRVLRVPDRFEPEDACLAEVLPGAAAAAWRTGITSASRVLVVGQGLSGLILTALVKIHGCAELVVVEPHPSRQRLAREFGADHVVSGTIEECQDQVAALRSTGFDVAIIATRDCTVDAVVAHMRSKSRIVAYGGLDPNASLNILELHRRSVSLVKESEFTNGVLEARSLWKEAAELVADGLLPLHRLRTHTLPFASVEEAFGRREQDPDALHVVCAHPTSAETHARSK